MSFRSNIDMTGSRWFAILLLLVGGVLAYFLKSELLGITALTTSAGLYANKQFQDRMKVKYRENDKEHSPD